MTGETGYYVDRSTDGGRSFTRVKTLSADVVTWTDTNRSALTTTCYRVRAYDSGGASPSNTGCVLTPKTYEAEGSSPNSSVTPTPSVVSNTAASGGSLVSVAFTAVGGWLDLTTTTPATGVYGTKIRYLASPDGGRFVVKVGGVVYGSEVDGYAATQIFREAYLGEVDITSASSSRTLRFELTATSPSSTSKIQIDAITMVVAQFRYEAESLTTTTNGSQSDASDPGASNGKVNVAALNAVGGYVRYTIAVAAPGTYSASLRIRKGADRGRFQTLLDENTAMGSEVDGYASSNTLAIIPLGNVTIAVAGNHTVKLLVKGQNASANGLGITVDRLDLRLTAGNGCALFGDTLPDGAACSDTSLCTQNDVCQAGVCVGGTPVTCAAVDQCHTAGTCDPATGQCSNPAKPDGTTCDDGNACTQTDACQVGVCSGSHPVACTASDQCHEPGTCDPGTGQCSNPAKADGTTCNDGNACTQTDACQAGTCTGSTPVPCATSDQCHEAGTCDPGTGQCSNPAKTNGTACNDGNACTRLDTCQLGACTGSDPVICAPSDQCHGPGICDQATGLCSNPAKPDGVACNDGNACTRADSCQAGTCTGSNPVTCTASDQCHDAGSCDQATGQCSNPAKPNGAACNDGNACTRTDSCQAGACTGGNPITCTASDQCHDAGSCDQATGQCSNPAKPDGTACNDGSACTRTDSCQAGACTGGNPITCTASDQCHIAGSCDQATGQCSNPAKPDGTACNDGNACTLNDFCQTGTCAGRDPVVCPDWGPCFGPATCDPEYGNCRATAKADGTSCDDGNACTQADACQAGSCAGSPVTCTASDACHDSGTCDQATGQCSNPGKIGACLRNSPRISAGSLQTCALRADGSGACWGSNSYGEATPQAGTFAQISAGEGITCALKTDGTPQCWGSFEDPGFPAQESFVQISAGSHGACGLKADGWVRCWGRLPAPSRLYTQIAVGPSHGCGLLADGTVDCWGEIDYGLPNPPTGTFVQVVAGAHRACALRADGTAACWGQDAEQNPPPALTFERLAAAGTTTCGLQTSGEIACWGTGTLVQQMPPAGPFVNLTVGAYHACATRGDDSAVCWGADTSGTDPRGAATLPTGQIQQVSTAMDSGCTLDVTGFVSCWGPRRFSPPGGTFRQISVSPYNACGILTDGSGACWCWPGNPTCMVPSWAGPFLQVAVSDENVCWLTTEGTVICTMGWQPTPAGTYKQVSVQRNTICAVRVDGTAVCWGQDIYGNSVLPEGTWKQLSVGPMHSCGVKTDDSVVCWGDNSQGQASPPSGSFSAVAAGLNATCAIRTDGTLACWGRAMPSTNPPSPPPGPFQQLSVGMNYGYDGFCATSTSGQEWCWGEVARQPLACAVESDGVCISTDPVVCPVADQCHTQGGFDQITRRCSSPIAPDGTACSDGNACTQADTCQAGVCTGAAPVLCTTWDACQTNTCDPKTGQCVSGSVPDGTACDDGNACTQTDTCMHGWCSSGIPVECPTSDNPCVYGSMCDPMTGQCAPSSVAYNGSYCDDGNGCTLNDSCQNGACVGRDPVVCAGEGDCFQAGTCDPSVGRCSYPAKSEGASCDDRNPCTQSDVCQAGTCVGSLAGETCHAPTAGALAAGGSHTCALRTDGSIACWGSNYWGESSPPAGTFKQVVAGGSFTCALRTDGTPQCWGTNLSGQTNARPGPYTQLASGGNEACGLAASGQVECWGSNYHGLPTGTYSQIAMGDSHGCGLRSDGSISCWGSNWQGEGQSPAGTGYRKLAAGTNHSCAIAGDGSAVCWGHQQGTPPAGPFVDIVAGYEHTCALRSNGSVACWGPTYGGPPPGSFVALSAGSFHTCAMRGDSSVVCWGQDGNGEATVPTPNYAQATAGMQFCGLHSNGDVDCWGQGFQVAPPEGSFTQVAGGIYGQCGIKTDGTIACWDLYPYDQWTYVQPVPSGTFTQLSVGEEAACGVRDNGTLECWGRLIGNSCYDMPATSDFVEVAVGGGMACARRNTGGVVCWGNNNYGTPAAVFSQISAGQGHACGLKTDGSIACWGPKLGRPDHVPRGEQLRSGSLAPRTLLRLDRAGDGGLLGRHPARGCLCQPHAHWSAG